MTGQTERSRLETFRAAAPELCQGTVRPPRRRTWSTACRQTKQTGHRRALAGPSNAPAGNGYGESEKAVEFRTRTTCIWAPCRTAMTNASIPRAAYQSCKGGAFQVRGKAALARVGGSA